MKFLERQPAIQKSQSITGVESDRATKRNPLVLGAAIGAGTMITLGLFLSVGGAAGPGSTAVSTTTPAATVIPIQMPTNDRTLDAQKTLSEELERLWVDAPPRADRAAQQRRVDDYRKLRDFAERNRLVFPSGCILASRSYQVGGQFLLAKEQWEDCFLDGEARASDRAGLTSFVSILRNVGRNWLEYGADKQTRYAGETYLVACVRLVEGNGLNVGECRQDLLLLVGDESVWSPAARSPLLNDSTKKER